ncbi:hypothetical protein K470DRAFT_269779 [Piedraia hortae CBS 480.64]|uniref:UBX domain-containing protein n=1 Tax=Piedraia hortae CBS 480.64 TaxID=1314780 RepID=A0A6A7C1Q0_9PEZI|nr:hypothetical protein K470DRAFT_269779 [Piedraia hortae CBS 480.64]
MFYNGDLRSGISAAIQERKSVVCFVDDSSDEAQLWETSWLPQVVDDSNAQKCVLLKLQVGSQEARFLEAFLTIEHTPMLVTILNGKVLGELHSGISQDEFKNQLCAMLGPEEGLLSQQEGTAEQVEVQQAATAEQADADSASTATGVNGLFPERAQRMAAEKAAREAAEKAPLEKRQAARKGEPKLASARISNDSARETWITEQKKAKEENKRARARILAQIQSDKADRRAKAEAVKNTVAPSTLKSKVPQLPTTMGSSCSLQVRLFDGSSIRKNFSSSSQIDPDVRSWIAELTSQNGVDSKVAYTFRQIRTPLPARDIDTGEERKTLADIGLTPSATLIMVPIASAVGAYPSPSGAVGILGALGGLARSLWESMPSFTNPRAATAGTAATANDGEASKITTKQGANGDDRPAEFYNGNSSATQGRNDDDDDETK